MPRPPESTISASVSSGSPVETSSRRSTNLIWASGIFTAGRSTGAARPAWASAGRKTLGRSVAIHGDRAHVSLLRSLPAYTGRVATSLSPSLANATASAARPTPSRAASRARSSRRRLVTGPKMALGDSSAASSATAPTHTSPRYGASAACSSSQILVAPHSPSCLRPSSVAWSVSQRASAGPPSRVASPSTSDMTFLGRPLRSSSTTHQNAPAMAGLLDRFHVFAERPHQLLSRRGPPRPPPRPPPGNRWRRQSRRSKVLLGSRIIAKWPSLPRATPAPTPSLPSARRPQSEGASTAPSEASPQESTAPAKPALESAVWLPSSLDGLRFLAERPHQLLHCRRHVALDDAPGRPGRQRFQRDDAELRGFGGDPEVGGLEILDLLLLGAHDPFERRIARLVQALLGREHRRQREIENLQAALDLAPDADARAVDVDRFLHDPGGAGPAEQVGELSRDRAHVVVDRLAPAEDELGRLLLGDRGQRPRGGEGVGLGQGRIVHVDGAVAAHGQTRAQCLLGPLRAQGDGDHLGLSALFLDAQRLLHGELVVRGHDPGDPGGV